MKTEFSWSFFLNNLHPPCRVVNLPAGLEPLPPEDDGLLATARTSVFKRTKKWTPRGIGAAMLISSGTSWPSDAAAAAASRANSPCFRPSTLALAGAHHRTGSEMLTRIMGSLCKRCWGLRRWKSHQPDRPPAGQPDRRSPCEVDGSVPWDVSAAHLNASYAAGLRLLSSGAWELDPARLPRALPPAVLWRMVHLVRDPLETVLSAYHYHQVTAEPWVHVPGPAWHRRMGLRPALASRNQSFAQQLRSLDRAQGVALQAQPSRAITYSQLASRPRRPKREGLIACIAPGLAAGAALASGRRSDGGCR